MTVGLRCIRKILHRQTIQGDDDIPLSKFDIDINDALKGLGDGVNRQYIYIRFHSFGHDADGVPEMQMDIWHAGPAGKTEVQRYCKREIAQIDEQIGNLQKQKQELVRLLGKY